MKAMNIYFEDKDFKDIEKLKSNLSWRDFILLLVAHAKESIKRGDLIIGDNNESS